MKKSFALLPTRWAALLRHGLWQRARGQQRASVGAGLPPELAPDSPLMAACATLRAALAPGTGTQPPSPLTLVGTAAVPGCALTAAGLALVIAAEGRPTLLVDADLRAPRLHRLLGIDEGPGFADLLAACQRQQNPEPWSEPQRVAPDLDVLPAGSAGIPVGTLLRPATLQAAMAALTARYEIVILAVTEQPPAPDALLVAGAAGTAILTVAAGSATQDELRRLRVRLERAGVSLLGFSYVEGA